MIIVFVREEPRYLYTITLIIINIILVMKAFIMYIGNDKRNVSEVKHPKFQFINRKERIFSKERPGGVLKRW